MYNETKPKTVKDASSRYTTRDTYDMVRLWDIREQQLSICRNGAEKEGWWVPCTTCLRQVKQEAFTCSIPFLAIYVYKNVRVRAR